jgi:hypothetical protein
MLWPMIPADAGARRIPSPVAFALTPENVAGADEVESSFKTGAQRSVARHLTWLRACIIVCKRSKQ